MHRNRRQFNRINRRRLHKLQTVKVVPGTRLISVKTQTPRQFKARLLINLAFATFIIGVSLAVGMVGYHYYCPDITWDEAFVDASMILTGMGPVDNPPTPWGKIFAGTYALYSGVIFLSMAAVVLAPALHYFITTLHVPVVGDKDEQKAENN